MKFSVVQVGLSVLATTGLMATANHLPLAAQSSPVRVAQSQTSIPPTVLAEIRQAPFSQVFSVDGGTAFGVKDKDYKSSEPDLGVFSLWADVPELDRVELVMKYCVENTDIARASASLVQISLADGDSPLVVIDQVIEGNNARLSEVAAPRTSGVSTSVYVDPFFNPYYASPFNVGLSYSPPVQIPAVDCSAGVTRFDLKPVLSALAQLPDQTLAMELLFSDGNTETWQLGGGTVSAIKALPSVQP